MVKHAVFADLLLHADDELSRALGAGIVERRTIHEWPLSCVQRVSLDDGRTLIYKTQLPPSVEAGFYARAVSPLLPGHRSLGKLGDCDTMILDWIDAPLLRDVARRDTEMVEHGRRLIARIEEIRSESGGDLPAYLDVGSIEAWRGNAVMALEKLRALVLDGRFRSIDPTAVQAVTSWSTARDVLAAASASPRLTHGDLKGDQVFVTSDGYRVINWQRPVIAPPDTDLVSLLVEEGMQPDRFIDVTIIRMFWFLRLCWAVEAQFDLFPDFTGGPFERWAKRAVRHILA
jgi:hypothetical protein